MQHTIGGCKPIGLLQPRCYGTFCRVPSMIGTASYDLARQLQMPQDPQGRWQVLRLLQPARRREERSEGNFQASLFDEGAAREPAAVRGRSHGQEGRHRRGIEMAEDAQTAA